ncbi:MAG: acyloxyacyl hydrolase [Acidobacteriota bacterium]
MGTGEITLQSNGFRVLLLLAVWLALPAAGVALDAKGWALYGGIYDTRADDSPIEAGLEYRWPKLARPKLSEKLSLVPAVGIAGSEDGNAWIYGGLRLDIEAGSRWVVTPQFSVSLYEDGDGKDLGGVLEFRSGLEVAYRYAKGRRLGVLFYHLSNAGLYEPNPGSNSLVLIWGFGR